MKEPKEVTDYWKRLKQFGTEEDKKSARPVYLYIQSLLKENANLLKKLEEFMIPQMFAKKPITQQELVKIKAIEDSIKVSMARSDEKKVYEPLKVRLRKMILDNKTETEEWARTLKWNSLTEEEARKLAGDYE